LQPLNLKLVTSHLAYKLGLGSKLPKKTLRPKIGGGLGWGTSKKNWDLLLISASIETSNSKPLGCVQQRTQLEFGE